MQSASVCSFPSCSSFLPSVQPPSCPIYLMSCLPLSPYIMPVSGLASSCTAYLMCMSFVICFLKKDFNFVGNISVLLLDFCKNSVPKFSQFVFIRKLLLFIAWSPSEPLLSFFLLSYLPTFLPPSFPVSLISRTSPILHPSVQGSTKTTTYQI